MIKVEILPGTSIREAAELGLKISNDNNESAMFKFNGIAVKFNKNYTVDEIIWQYNVKMNKYQEENPIMRKIVCPCCNHKFQVKAYNWS